MNDPKWKESPFLRALFERWRRSRGERIDTAQRPFSIAWETILQEARLLSAEERAEAERDVRELQQLRFLQLKTLPRRPPHIERVVLPLENERALRELFGHRDPREAMRRLEEIFAAAAQRSHPLFEERWKKWCGACASGGGTAGFAGQSPEALAEDLDLLFELTSRVWPPQTPIRTASVALGRGSKVLENARPRLERGLSSLLQRPAALEDLGIVLSTPLLLLHGPLQISFREGMADFRSLRGVIALSELDLERAIQIETPAERILTIENTKTTFHQFAAANHDSATLLVGAAAVTTPVRLLISKLASACRHFHFGDSDPSGFQILLQFRQAFGRDVSAFRMEYRPHPDSCPLTAQQRYLAEKLKKEPLLADVRPALEALLREGKLGRFEQECLGPPTLSAWPFFRE